MNDYEYKLREYSLTLSPKQIEYITLALENLGIGGVEDNYFLNDCGEFVLEDMWNQIHKLEKKAGK